MNSNVCFAYTVVTKVVSMSDLVGLSQLYCLLVKMKVYSTLSLFNLVYEWICGNTIISETKQKLVVLCDVPSHQSGEG